MGTLSGDDGRAAAPVPGPRSLHRLEAALVAVAAACILAIGALITAGIASRFFFNWSPSDTLVIVRELMVGATVLPLAYVAAERAHIAVEVFTNMMGRRAQPVLDLLGSLVGLLVLLPIIYGGWVALREVVEDQSYFFGDLELPEWPGRLAFVAGFVTFALRMLVLVVVDARRSLHGPDQPADQPTEA